MRISEILFWNSDAAEENRPDPQPGLPSAPFIDDPTNLANAFTRSGVVKSFWNLPGSEGQPPGPAPPDAETALIPSGTLEPTTTASWEAEPVPKERAVGQHRLVPTRQCQGAQTSNFTQLADTTPRLHTAAAHFENHEFAPLRLARRSSSFWRS
jgi:hypothetical protein